MFTPAAHDLDVVVFSLKDCFYASFPQVFHPSCQIEGYRLSPGRGAKGDPLDTTGNDCMGTLHLTTP